jgi:hypothetical protein
MTLAWSSRAGSRDRARTIGPVGTWSRVFVAAGFLYLALFDGTRWGLEWYDAAVGVGGLPAAALAFGLAARRFAREPVRFGGPAGAIANCIAIVALVVEPYTAGGAALFYGTTLLVAAARDQPGCEATVLPNWILRRRDEIGCPLFSVVDAAEARRSGRRGASGAARA